MTDVERALMGDRAAQERLTAAGVLLPCPFCGGTEILEGSLRGEVWYFCGRDECASLGAISDNEYGARLTWNTRTAILAPEQLAALEKMEGSEIGEHSTNQV